MHQEKNQKSKLIIILIPIILIVIGLILVSNSSSKEKSKEYLLENNDLQIEVKLEGSDTQTSQGNIQSGELPDLGAATTQDITGSGGSGTPTPGQGIDKMLEGKDIEIEK